MLKYDRDVKKTLDRLEKAGFQTYAAGDCFLSWVLGEDALDWELITTADGEALKTLFPESILLDKETGARQLSFRDEEVLLDITPAPQGIEEALKARTFTLEAVAEHPEKGLLDPCGGMQDIRDKLIRTTGDPDEQFRQDPDSMLRALRYVSELGFDLSQSVLKAIRNHYLELMARPTEDTCTELLLLMGGAHAGKALRMLADTGLLAAVYGPDVSRKLSGNEQERYMTLVDKIEETKQIPLRRTGMLYAILEDTRGNRALKQLPWNDEDRTHLDDAINRLLDLQLINDKVRLKQFIAKYGWDRFHYLFGLNKASRIIFEGTSFKLEAMNLMLKDIRNNGEAVLISDLAIDANDIMEAGITDDPAQAEQLLEDVLAKVHKDPRNNVREPLLKLAKKYKRNPFASKTRYVRWIR